MVRRQSLHAASATLSLVAVLLATPMWAHAVTFGFLTKWGAPGTSAGQFDAPAYLAVDRDANVFVVDQENHRIQKFGSDGTYLTQWGSQGSGNGEFQFPIGVAVNAAGEVYVVDLNNARVQKFTSGGAYLTQWGSPGSGDGQFSDPVDVAIDGVGSVYVTDALNGRVQKFTSDGTFVTQWGSWGSGDGELMYPTGIEVDAGGSVYVCDNWNHRIQKFTSDGAYLTQWGGPGSASGQFNYPLGIAVDADGRVFVGDGANHRIQAFTSDGSHLTEWGGQGSADGQFDVAYGVAVDRAGNVYASDLGNQRIQKFARLPALVTVDDVRNDQGRQVRVRFTSMSLDVAGSPSPVVAYHVFRRIDASPSMTADGLAGATPGHGEDNSTAAAIRLAGWDNVGSVPAFCDDEYNLVVPTLADSALAGMRWSVFFVRAATAVPSVYFDSAPDSGCSVDNLPPAAPAPFTAAYAAGATALHWGRNGEPDLWVYRLYRGGSADFEPGPSNLVVVKSDTGHVDVGPAGSHYKLSAMDFNGNESAYASMTPGATLEVPPAGRPELSLDEVRPNPTAGHRLRVGFTLTRQAPATLALIDVAGRRLFQREVGSFGPGRHTVDLVPASRLAPGLYLVRLAQGTDARVRRVLVVD